MTSKKTIKLDDEINQITFTFYKIVINISIIINNNTQDIIIDHSEFEQKLSELKNDYVINDHKIHLIQKWFNKNYKKLYPTTEYTTKYGRKIKLI